MIFRRRVSVGTGKIKGLEVVPVNVDRASEPPGGGEAALNRSIAHPEREGI
jgi:hypothetical protein